MNAFKRGSVRVPVWAIIILVTVVLGLVIYAWLSDASDPKLIGVLGGLLAGLIVYGLSFLTEFTVYRELDRFQSMGVKNLLQNRHDKTYYRPILAKAETRVCVMGSSCSRFITDFLDPDTDDHVLIERLRMFPEMSVRILVPQSRHMDAGTKRKFQGLSQKIERLEKDFKGRFEIREFPYKARHSFVITDKELIAGPIFEGIESKNSPAVHVSASTPFAEKYIKHFDNVWDRSDGKQ